MASDAKGAVDLEDHPKSNYEFYLERSLQTSSMKDSLVKADRRKGLMAT